MPHLTLEVSPQALAALEQLLATGLYGTSLRDVAEQLLYAKLRQELPPRQRPVPPPPRGRR